ncbi:cell wall protein [Streptomyces samsunensis]|uniref:cell wall protein n=1 Tax=Streptomyces malaysiensis TaxID=92644 RepID=UPI0015834E31|nr:cell wall protein [Streptomyces samsunensis]NUH43205.1 cell wall protein [Streptomyces samsunensis]
MSAYRTGDPLDRRRFLTAAALRGATVIGTGALSASALSTGVLGTRVTGTTGATGATGATGVIGATALGAVDADAAFAAPIRPLDPAVARSAFAEGRIAAINGDVLEVAGSYGDHSRVRITGATSVWKGRATTAADIETGDGLYARGLPLPDGTLAADAVWVNIVNLHATIRGIEKTRLHLAHGQHEIIGNLMAERTSAAYGDASPTADLSRLTIGQSAQVLGAWRPSDGSVDLVRVAVAPGAGRRR